MKILQFTDPITHRQSSTKPAAGDMAHNSLLLISLLSLLSFTVTGRLSLMTTTSSSDLISDGGVLRHNPFLASESEWCEQTYGFMPCSNTAVGNLFHILVYGYLMYLAATYLSAGSELLLEILGPGLVGGLLLPILGALPDSMLILVSGISGSVKIAQDQVSVGMGFLAGSTVMRLTIIWGCCIVVGKCDIQNSVAVDNQDTKGSGVSTDIWTSYSAMIMAASLLPFIVVQFPQVLHLNSERHLAVLISLVISVSLLIAYCLFQVFQPKLQKRRIAFAKHKHVRSAILKHLKMRALGRLVDDQGQPNREVLKRLFRSIDVDCNEYLSPDELKALVIGIRFYEINLGVDDIVAKLIEDFGTSDNNLVDFEGFVSGVEKWIEEAKATRINSPASPGMLKYIHDYYEETKRSHDLLGDEGGGDVDRVHDHRWTTIKAALYLLLGTVIAAVFADPLVDVVGNFSAATNIPSFFVSFIALPLLMNSSEAVSTIIFATRKKRRSASLSFSELYGAATMSNILCLSVFLALVYIRGLTWDFSSEVLVILIVCIVMGVFGSLHTTFPLWTSFIAFILYPFSLILVYLLDYVFGWS